MPAGVKKGVIWDSGSNPLAMLQLWLDGADIDADGSNNSAYSQGSSIDIWSDKSGLGNHAVAVVAPTYDTTNKVAFAGAEYFNLGDFSARTAGEIFVVIKIKTDPPTSNNSGLWAFGTDSIITHYPWTSGVIYDGFGTTSRKTTIDPTPPLTTFNIYNVISSFNFWENRLNGTVLHTTTVNTVGFRNACTLGKSAGNAYIDGYIKEVRLYKYKLSPQDRASINNELTSKWGL